MSQLLRLRRTFHVWVWTGEAHWELRRYRSFPPRSGTNSKFTQQPLVYMCVCVCPLTLTCSSEISGCKPRYHIVYQGYALEKHIVRTPDSVSEYLNVVFQGLYLKGLYILFNEIWMTSLFDTKYTVHTLLFYYTASGFPTTVMLVTPLNVDGNFVRLHPKSSSWADIWCRVWGSKISLAAIHSPFLPLCRHTVTKIKWEFFSLIMFGSLIVAGS